MTSLIGKRVLYVTEYGLRPESSRTDIYFGTVTGETSADRESYEGDYDVEICDTGFYITQDANHCRNTCDLERWSHQSEG
jgi:hypothetical protein